jgi:hypothetical protein
MTTRDPRTGRFVGTANTPSATEGKFATYTDMPVEFEGADPNDLAYDAMPRRAPEADELAQGGSRFPVRGRHPALIAADGQARSRFGAQGALVRDAARLQGVPPALAYVLGIDDATGPSRSIKESTDGN